MGTILCISCGASATMHRPVVVCSQQFAMRKRIYFKRHRMELDLRYSRPSSELPPGFYWVPWENGVLDLHAQVKFQCFSSEMDACVFPALSTLAGCRDLMAAIATQPAFCPSATWLVAGKAFNRRSLEARNDKSVLLGLTSDVCVATVQGLLDANRYGGIQNLGVIDGFRGLGIGWAILLKSLEGFAASGARRAFLEVTAKNELAVRMYRRLGFRSVKTIYREVDVEEQTQATSIHRGTELPSVRECIALSPG
jgi:GNAT superfamily N-acetyltransferase